MRFLVKIPGRCKKNTNTTVLNQEVNQVGGQLSQDQGAGKQDSCIQLMAVDLTIAGILDGTAHTLLSNIHDARN